LYYLINIHGAALKTIIELRIRIGSLIIYINTHAREAYTSTILHPTKWKTNNNQETRTSRNKFHI